MDAINYERLRRGMVERAYANKGYNR